MEKKKDSIRLARRSASVAMQQREVELSVRTHTLRHAHLKGK